MQHKKTTDFNKGSRDLDEDGRYRVQCRQGEVKTPLMERNLMSLYVFFTVLKQSSVSSVLTIHVVRNRS